MECEALLRSRCPGFADRGGCELRREGAAVDVAGELRPIGGHGGFMVAALARAEGGRLDEATVGGC